MPTVTDYNSLTAAILAYAHRANMAANVDYLIQAAQAQIENDIVILAVGDHIRFQENSYPPIAIDANGHAPVPADWLAPKLLTVTGQGGTFDLEFTSPEWIYTAFPCRAPGGIPRFVARDVAANGTGWPATGGTLSFTTTNDQTAFDLSAGPLGVAVILVSLDGAVLAPGTDYTLIGLSLTLLTPTLAGQALLVTFAASGLAPPTASNSSVLIFGPYPDSGYTIGGTYYAEAPLLTVSAPTNWMTTNAPGVIHAACMVQVGLYIPDDKLIARWNPLYQQRLQALVDSDKAERWAAGTGAVRRA
jgi:hypothetical protein